MAKKDGTAGFRLFGSAEKRGQDGYSALEPAPNKPS